jgi:hypothetical protein
MKLQKIKLFKNQPPIRDIHINDLIKRGLVTKFINAQGKAHHKRPGWVVGYPLLTKALKEDKVSQTDARRLLVIEIAATDGKPRKTHVDRLLVASFVEDRAAVIDNIETYRS